MAYKTHYFDAPVGITFRLVLGNSTYSVAVLDRSGKRIEWTGRKWGPSVTGALSMAAHTGLTSDAESAIDFLFSRIDGYKDSPGLIDLWSAAQLRTNGAA